MRRFRGRWTDRNATVGSRRSICVLVLAVMICLLGGTAQASTTDVPVPSVSFGNTEGDYVHRSRTLPLAASAHGWWTYPTKTELRADVTVQLQARRAEGWVDVGPAGVERVRPGGGSANRSNARVPRATTESTEGRSVVDVDVVGRLDSPGKLYTPVRRLDCSP